MLQVVIIGLGTFSIRLLQELNAIDADVIVIDKDRAVIEKYKNMAKEAYITDAINEDALKKIVPIESDAVVIDFGESLEASILITNYLHKMGIKKIIVEAQSDEQGEVLKLVGATQVIFPEQEAAKRLTPLLASSILFNYMQISPYFALAEISVTDLLAGKTLLDSNMRQKYKLNVVAYRKDGSSDFQFIQDPSFILEKEFILLVAGTNDALHHFLSEENNLQEMKKLSGEFSFFSKLFPNHK